MNWKRLPDKEVTKTIKQIEVDGVVLYATHELYDLLHDLETSDCCISSILINDELGTKLKTLGVASRDIKGSYSYGNKKKLKELKSIVLDVLYGDKKCLNI
jgi:hypothetical protein